MIINRNPLLNTDENRFYLESLDKSILLDYIENLQIYLDNLENRLYCRYDEDENDWRL